MISFQGSIYFTFNDLYFTNDYSMNKILISEYLWLFLRKSAGASFPKTKKNHNPCELWFYFGIY